MPNWLQTIARLNPITYSADLTRTLFITGEIFGTSQALSMGFLYGIERNENGALQALISDIERGGPQAQTHIKRLLDGDILSRKIEEI